MIMSIEECFRKPHRSPGRVVVKVLIVLLCVQRISAAQADPATNLAAAPTTSPIDRVPHLLKELHDPDSPFVLVVAHRAGWKYAPENSIAGIRKCIDMGADMLEIDLHKTSDGHFVLMHDKTLDRTTTGTGLVSDWTLNQIEQLWLRDGRGKPTSERVPTLEQLVNLSRDHILIYLDKTEDCIDEVYARLVELNAVQLCVFYGERPDAITKGEVRRAGRSDFVSPQDLRFNARHGPIHPRF